MRDILFLVIFTGISSGALANYKVTIDSSFFEGQNRNLPNGLLQQRQQMSSPRIQELSDFRHGYLAYDPNETSNCKTSQKGMLSAVSFLPEFTQTWPYNWTALKTLEPTFYQTTPFQISSSRKTDNIYNFFPCYEDTLRRWGKIFADGKEGNLADLNHFFVNDHTVVFHDQYMWLIGIWQTPAHLVAPYDDNDIRKPPNARACFRLGKNTPDPSCSYNKEMVLFTRAKEKNTIFNPAITNGSFFEPFLDNNTLVSFQANRCEGAYENDNAGFGHRQVWAPHILEFNGFYYMSYTLTNFNRKQSPNLALLNITSGKEGAESLFSIYLARSAKSDFPKKWEIYSNGKWIERSSRIDNCPTPYLPVHVGRSARDSHILNDDGILRLYWIEEHFQKSNPAPYQDESGVTIPKGKTFWGSTVMTKSATTMEGLFSAPAKPVYTKVRDTVFPPRYGVDNESAYVIKKGSDYLLFVGKHAPEKHPSLLNDSIDEEKPKFDMNGLPMVKDFFFNPLARLVDPPHVLVIRSKQPESFDDGEIVGKLPYIATEYFVFDGAPYLSHTQVTSDLENMHGNFFPNTAWAFQKLNFLEE